MSLRKGLKVTYAIWLRDFLTFSREKARIIAMVGQPFFYLAILGRGITSGMSFTTTGAVTYSKFMYPGVIGLSMLFTSIFSAMSIIWDREFGFLKEVLVAPVPRWSVAIGKSFGGATVALAQAVMLIILSPLAGIWPPTPLLIIEIIGLSFLISFATTSLGVVIASRMSSMQGFQVVMNFLVLPLYFLSGAMFPMSKAPLWMRSLMAIDPLTYGVDGLRNVVFAQGGGETPGGVPVVEIARQAGLLQHSLGVDVLVTFAAAVLLALAGVWSFNKTTAT
jgi:ABC-2 type transport system permease protein